jgi:Tol biopolymer transport system component
MKNKKLVLALIGLALFLALVYVVVESQQAKDTKGTTQSVVPLAHFETTLIGKGSSPKWSPDGTKIAFISEDEWLTIADADGMGENKKVAPHNFGTFDWLDSSTFIVTSSEFKEENGKRVSEIWKMKTITTGGRESLIVEDIAPYRQEHDISVPYFLKDGTVGYYEGRFTLPGKDKVFKVIKPGKLKQLRATKELRATTPDGYVGTGPILLKSIDGSVNKVITKTKTAYSFPQLSPDGTKIATNIMRGDIVVLDTSGNELANLGRGIILYRGTTGCWSPDSKQIVYNLTKESEYYIEASEIFIVNWDGTGKKQITDTPDEVELEPIWSPDGTKILCRSDNANKIFVIKVR